MKRLVTIIHKLIARCRRAKILSAVPTREVELTYDPEVSPLATTYAHLRSAFVERFLGVEP